MFTKGLFTFNKFSVINYFKNYVHSEYKLTDNFVLNGVKYMKDDFTNITPRVISKIGSNLHNNLHHPLGILSERIKDFFYKNYRKHYRTPLYSIYDNFSPIVTTKQNFDELLIPENHISRQLSDSYYINRNTMLRAHTSAHESDLIKSGLNAFLVIGDVYRRDEIDRTHYPVFHQAEGVRLFTKTELFSGLEGKDNLDDEEFILQTESQRLNCESRPSDKQEKHSALTAHLIELELKKLLEDLTISLLGPNTQHRWVSAYFPWTHPSFELEIQDENGEWIEMLGCGVVEQDMLNNCGVEDMVGLAFGLGLERWAMHMFSIPDIRLFWSKDAGFLSQFQTDDIFKPIKYKEVSVYPECILDMSFWLPTTCADANYHSNDFYEIAGSIAGDKLERVVQFDEFKHLQTGRESRAYRLHYRDMHKNLTKEEVKVIHDKIAAVIIERFGCEIR